MHQSSAALIQQAGASTGAPVWGIFMPGGQFILDTNGNRQEDSGDFKYGFGLSGDIAIVGDWNGDGVTKIGVFRGGQWFLDYNGNGIWDGPDVDRHFAFGLSTDSPVVGDWDGTGTTKIGVVRAGGSWSLDWNGNGNWDGETVDRHYQFGNSSMTAVVGDWTGDGRTKIGMFEGGHWWLDTDGNGAWDEAVDTHFQFGSSSGGDLPLVGDWNGTGTDKAAVLSGDARRRTGIVDYDGSHTWSSDNPQQTINYFPDQGDRGQRFIAKRWSGTETTAQFVARAAAGGGSTDITTNTERVTFVGCLPKGKTADPRVLGAAQFLTNLTTQEYRLTSLAYHLDTSRLREGETVESDIGFTILAKDKLVALNSGEETLITHRYDVTPDDRGIFRMTVPAGGIPIPPNMRMSVGSVSALFPANGSGAITVDDARIADGEFMRVCYEAGVVLAGSAAPVASYRSPYRDRAYVPTAGRLTAPYTDFRNATARPIRVYGIAPFLSNMSSNVRTEHGMRVLVNESEVLSVPLPPHVPGVTTPSYPIVNNVDITLAPGDVLSVRGIVTPERAMVYDFAAFIFADPGLVSANEQLDAVQVDLNGDGYNDIVDIDATGSLWVSVRVGAGLQDTQTQWNTALKGVDRLEVQPGTSPPILRATNSRGLCLNLTPRPSRFQFLYDYCNSTSASTDSDLWGDFNGDGWPDRMRVSSNPVGYQVELGSAAGLGPPVQWVTGYGATEKMFAWDADADGRTDLTAEWTDTSGSRCAVWRSTGSSFIQTSCR